jgi:hypothetical protein
MFPKKALCVPVFDRRLCVDRVQITFSAWAVSPVSDLLRQTITPRFGRWYPSVTLGYGGASSHSGIAEFTTPCKHALDLAASDVSDY